MYYTPAVLYNQTLLTQPGGLGRNVPQRESLRPSYQKLGPASVRAILHHQDPARINGLRENKKSSRHKPTGSRTRLLRPVRLPKTQSTRPLTEAHRVLIHAPYGGKEARLGSWRALVEAQKSGKTRSIGVSNYGIHHLDELEEYINGGGGGKIDVGQYELHPWLDRTEIADWLKKRNIVVEAYSPLAHGSRMKEPVLHSLGRKYKKSPAQIMIRWGLQRVCLQDTC